MDIPILRVKDAEGNIIEIPAIRGEKGAKGDKGDAPPLSEIVNLVYPIGSIYMSVNSTSPATLFGGTWEQLKDRFLLGAGDTYSNGATGGATSASHKHLSPTGYDGVTIYGQTLNGGKVVTGGGYVASGQVTKTTSGNIYLGYTSNETINTMPPYLVVYMWKRTA